MNIHPSSKSSGLALSFTESPMFISPVTSDDSTNSAINQSYDGILHVAQPLADGLWTQPASTLRGGFRFMTLVSTSNDAVAISNISCSISFMPHVEDLRAYSGYFYAKDPAFHDCDFLTKVRQNPSSVYSHCLRGSLFPQLWYAGAYTVQTNTVPVNTGRQVPFVRSPGEIGRRHDSVHI